MNNKQQILTALREEFKRWEDRLSGMNEAQITAPQLASHWSVKDVIAHLWLWQQRSIARLEAALHNREPEFPTWPAEFDPEVEGEPDQLNTWLYETNREKPWLQVRRDWQEVCLRELQLGEEIPEKDLLDPERYAWMEGAPLSRVFLATYEHYEEHREWLFAWLRRHGI